MQIFTIEVESATNPSSQSLTRHGRNRKSELILPVDGTLSVGVEPSMEKCRFNITGAIEYVPGTNVSHYPNRVTVRPTAALRDAHQAWQDATAAVNTARKGNKPEDEVSGLERDAKLLQAQYEGMDRKGKVVLRDFLYSDVLTVQVEVEFTRTQKLGKLGV
jgi:hypothetical protein